MVPSMPSRTFALFGVLGAIAVGCGGKPTPNETVNAGSTGANSSSGSPSGSTQANTGTAGGTATAPGSGATAAATVGSGSSDATSGSVGGTEGTSGGASSGIGSTAATSTGASGDDSGAMTSDGGNALTMMSDGGRPSGMSAGCGQPPPTTEAIGTATLQMIDITGLAQEYVAGYTHRKYCTTIPKGYDPSKAYPVVFYGTGCGATGCEGSSFTGRTDIFYVEAISTTGCFQTGKESTVDSPELNYFDQVMAHV